MAVLTRAQLKAFFETADIPTQSEFASLIDSFLSLTDNHVVGWQKVTLGFADFQPEVTAQSIIDAFSVPAGFQPTWFVIVPTTGFTGGVIASADVELFDANEVQEFENSSFSVFAAPGDTSGISIPALNTGGDVLSDISSASPIRIAISVGPGGSVVDDLTAGSLDLYYLLGGIPF